MKRLFLFLCLLSFAQLNATLPEGSQAQDFTLKDTEGNIHSLYADYLNQGMSAVIDMSATWCGPCWEFHQTGIMDNLYADYGPGGLKGNNMVMSMMIEVDPSTNLACLDGDQNCNSANQGDWKRGTQHPMFNPSSANAARINEAYDISAYPTIYLIAPSGYIKTFEGTATSYNEIESWAANSFQMENTTWTTTGGCQTNSIDLHPYRGQGIISYTWSSGHTSEDIAGLSAGDYYVTMTDENSYAAVIGPITIASNQEMTSATFTANNVACHGGSDGQLSVAPQGGSGNFTYAWSNGATIPSITNLTAATYHVTITDAVTGCELIESYVVTAPTELNIQYNLTDASCSGDFGVIEIQNTGGIAPYTYFINGIKYSSDRIALAAGDYNLNVQDANGCNSTAQFTVGQQVNPIAVSDGSEPLSCQTSSVILSASGSTEGSSIQYDWYNSTGNYIGTGMEISVNTPDSYLLFVRDTNTGCTATSTVVLASNEERPNIAITASNNIDCSNPSAILTGSVSQSDLQVSYSWTTTDGVIQGSGRTEVITVTSAGNYELLVTNLTNGCIATTNYTVLESDLPEVSMDGSSTFCYGESTEICLSLGSSQSAVWTLDGELISNANCVVLENEGLLSVRLTDNLTGCSAVENIEITTTTLPNTEFTGQDSFCENESATLCYNSEQGIAKSWFVNGEEISNQECIEITTTSTIELLAINEQTQCSNSETIEVTQLATPEVSISDTGMLSCDSPTTTLSIDNTTGTSEILWLDASGTVIGTDLTIDVEVTGEYSAQVINENGCITEAHTVVEADDSLPQIDIVTPTEISCANSTTTLSINQNSNLASISWYDANGNLIGSEEEVDVTSVGSYSVVVTSEKGCEISKSVQVIEDVTIPAIDNISALINDCEDGSVILEANTSNVTDYRWTDSTGATKGTKDNLEVSIDCSRL